MRVFVRRRVLHVVFSGQRLPRTLAEIADAYEGPVPGRIGVNVPMHVVRRHLPGHVFDRDDADYIIGYPDWEPSTARHERLHAKYFQDAEYRQYVKELWQTFPRSYRSAMLAKLEGWGYPRKVCLDEWQAYFFAGGLEDD